MKTAYLKEENIKTKKASYLSELCYQSPFLIINTPCGVGKYKFNKIGYDDNNSLVLEYIITKDDKYLDTNSIIHKLGKFYYLSATQLLYAFKYYANT
tara:strand:- start:598 stop:888 length:291 start_codon:yes stop_codon:yes gene_type:complete